MTPAARVQAAIDLLDAIIAAARDNGPAADTLIARYFQTRRYAGSKDRRAVRELVYRAIRQNGESPASGRAAMVGLAHKDAEFAALFDGSAHGPAPIDPSEPVAGATPLPAWIMPRLANLVDRAEQSALLERAPLHVRVNALKANQASVMDMWPGSSVIAGTKHGLAVPEGTAVEGSEAFVDGLLEVQDAGSQMIVSHCLASAGMTVLDLCAGAGGKTLALAAAMGGQGRLIAADTDRARLARLLPRAQRAGAEAMIETRLLNSGQERVALSDLAGCCDVVLIDAPCSGTGTWRRNPEARWRLTPARLDRLMAVQAHLLDVAVPLVRPGGALVYAVCSLLDGEGRGQAEAWLARNPGWRADDAASAGRVWGPGRLLTPAHDGTDGFYHGRFINSC
jgi:16S rRNA (cytosine967-C5)-methyltransferase